MRPVWITRAEPGAGETAARVRALGLEALIEPLLEVRPLDVAAAQVADVGAIAFTSANAVRAFAARWPERGAPVFAVGGATARAAAAAGFTQVVSADGDVAALARLITDRRATIAGMVLHASAAEAAGDLTGDLAASGVAARRLPLYETAPRPPGPAVLDRLAGGAVVLLHSPRAARILREAVAPGRLDRLTALCLSPAVAMGLGEAQLAGVRSAAEPNEAALIALLSDHVQTS
jgi:uroporphyrinogen-III synthase